MTLVQYSVMNGSQIKGQNLAARKRRKGLSCLVDSKVIWPKWQGTVNFRVMEFLAKYLFWCSYWMTFVQYWIMNGSQIKEQNLAARKQRKGLSCLVDSKVIWPKWQGTVNFRIMAFLAKYCWDQKLEEPRINIIHIL